MNKNYEDGDVEWGAGAQCRLFMQSSPWLLTLTTNISMQLLNKQTSSPHQANSSLNLKQKSVCPLANVLGHCKEDPTSVLPEMKLHCLVPNSYILVSVNNLYSIFPRPVHLHYFAAAK